MSPDAGREHVRTQVGDSDPGQDEEPRIPRTVQTELRGRLDELRTWRIALCLGAWFGFPRVARASRPITTGKANGSCSSRPW